MKFKDENGNVVIEASIVMTIAVVMVAVLINLGIMMYNRNLMESVATEAAVDVANVYASAYRDPMYGYIDSSEFYKTNLYRHLGNIFTSALDNTATRKAEWYSEYSLKKHQLSEIDNTKIHAEIVRKPGTILQHQVVVTIEGNFDAPLTAIWGGDNKASYAVEGRADCIDLLDYFNTVGTVKETVMDRLDKFVEDITKFINIFDFSKMGG